MLRIRSLRELVGATTPSGPPAAARVIVGAAAALKAGTLAIVLLPRLRPDTVRVPAFPFVPPASAVGITTILTIWLVAALMFTAGFRTRTAGSVLVAAMVALVSADLQFYSNHLYLNLLLVFLLTVADSGASSSVDSLLHGHREWIPAWPMMLFCAQLSIVYGFAAIAKFTPEFLSGAIIAQSWSSSGLLPLPEFLRRWEFMAPLGMAGFATEAFLAIGFWVSRWRKAALGLGIALHLSIILTMGDVFELTIFTALMASMMVVHFGAELQAWKERSGVGRATWSSAPIRWWSRRDAGGVAAEASGTAATQA